MRRLRNHLVGIDQGTLNLFSDFRDGGEMWTGSGPRERRRAVTFSEPFAEPPVVQVALSLWDIDKSANVRAEVAAEQITETGFEIVFRTWSDTRVARVNMTWLAIGPMRNEDDWDVC